MSPANLELKTPGPSMGHSLLVQGLEKLLTKDHQLARQVTDPSAGVVEKWVSNEDEDSGGE